MGTGFQGQRCICTSAREKADTGLDVYRGTADAISQNIDFIDQYDPEYLLVLSGDHIYKMNYDKMLAFHKERQADATIAVIEVPLKEASRFGIMNTDGETDRITEFVEKPPVPQSNLASMGIYIFNWKLLRKLLLADMKNRIPAMTLVRTSSLLFLAMRRRLLLTASRATGRMLEP